jgi:hypothetical protein
MDIGSSSLRPHRFHAPLAGAAACLVVWMGLFPVAEAWHLSLARHSHRHCLMHNQMEEVVAPPGPSTDDAAGGTSLRAPRGTPFPEKHVACRLLNFDTPRSSCVPRAASFSTTAAPRPSAIPVPVDQPSDTWVLILIAPKNSPPLAAF